MSLISKLLWAISLYGVKTKKGIVEIRIDNQVVQVSPEEAREFALSVFHAADSAESDEFIMTWFESIGGKQIDPTKLLLEFRKFRESKMKENK